MNAKKTSGYGNLQMGHQLWASPVTGYRRRGTRLNDFQEALGDKINITAIYEPLLSCSSLDPAAHVQEELVRRDFDIVGVRDSGTGVLLGLARRSSLTSGLVSECVEEISPEEIIDTQCSVRGVLKLFATKSYVFVKQDDDIGHIVTRADLNKPIVRAYLFGLISLLEIHLSFWVSELYPDESWVEILRHTRLRKARDNQTYFQSIGHGRSLIECLQFCDKREIIVKHSSFHLDLGFKSRKETNYFLEKAEVLRNHLAHSQYDLTSGSSWEIQIDLLRRVDSMLSLSDELVEKNCADKADAFMSMLWCDQRETPP